MKKQHWALLTALFLMLPLLCPVVSAGLMDTEADPAPVVTSGSFAATSGTKMDFTVSGGTLTGAQWTIRPHFTAYNLTGTFRAGDTISLSVTGTEALGLADSTTSHLVFNSVGGYIDYYTGTGARIGETQRYQSEYVQSPSLSHEFTAAIPAEAQEMVIRAQFVCRWAVDYSLLIVDEFVVIDLRLKVEKDPDPAVVLTTVPKPSPTSAIIPTPKPSTPANPGEVPTGSDKNPLVHAGPLATLLIGVVAAVAALVGGGLGTAAGMAEDNREPAALDPAYEAANVPDAPAFVVGQDGERLTRKPDHTIEVSYPNGDVAIHFPNGTVQARRPDGTTWEEWPDGTISTTDENGTFIVQKTDGTLSAREPNGDETVYHPDGTLIETRSNGMQITRDAEGEVVVVAHNGYITRRHPTTEDAFVMTSPHGGSVVYRTERRDEPYRNEQGQWETRTVEKTVVEGEIRTRDATHIFHADGYREMRGDDGARYVEQADGSLDASSPDGTHLKYDAKTGKGDFRFADGSFARINTQTGEIHSVLTDGSYWQRDARGNGSFVDNAQGTRGICREDGSFELQSRGGTFTQQADGTMGWQGEDGTALVEKADGTVTVSNKQGASLTRNPDGTGFYRQQDGTVVPLPAIPR